MPKRKRMENVSKITWDICNVYTEKAMFSQIFFNKPAMQSMRVNRITQPSFKVCQWSAHPLILQSYVKCLPKLRFMRKPKRVLLYDPQKHHLKVFCSHLCKGLRWLLEEKYVILPNKWKIYK